MGDRNRIGGGGTKFLCANRIRVFSISSVVIGGLGLALYALAPIDVQYGSALGAGPRAFASAVLVDYANQIYGLPGTSIEVTEPNYYVVSWIRGLATTGILFVTWWFPNVWTR